MNPIYRFQFPDFSKAINLYNYSPVPFIISATGKWAAHSDSNSGECVFLPLAGVISLTISCSGGGGLVAFLKSANPVNGQTPDFATGESRRTIADGTTETLVVPSDANYFYVCTKVTSGANIIPRYASFTTSQYSFPIYKDDLAKNYEKESGQEFFRAKLSGKLTFEKDDYTYIVSAAFDKQFLLNIYISYNGGRTWALYWTGTFWKTDCEFDGDAETVVVQPTVLDQYNDILAGLDKEYNLIDLAPSMAQIKADKRPMIQVYVPGQNVVGCFLSGMWWEQEAEPESDETKLVNDFKFALNKSLAVAEVSGTMSPQLPDFFTKVFTGEKFNLATIGTTDFVGTNYTFRYYFYAGGGGSTQKWQIVRNSDSTVMWEKSWTGGTLPDTSLPQTVVLSPVSGTGASGNVTLYVYQTPVYSRFVCDTAQVSGINTYAIPADDIVENNRNYTRVIGYYFPDTIYFSTALTETPNQWGLYQPGKYYQPPYLYWSPELFPVARNAWGRVSIWFTFSAFDWLVEESGRQSFTIRHAYPLWAVLNKLLQQVAPDIDFRANYTCSQFLYPYDVNPISGLDFGLFITPKSNIVTAGYDQPAQKAPITLGQVFNMLRDCFRCYWFIDENNHLHIEHIQYFRNGGSYSDTPNVGIDLTTQQVPRNGKSWAFARNQFKFDKPEMAARYQFGWMDDVTQLFDGFPIDIISKYVNPDNIEQIDVTKFTSDIDYILLNPSAISKDGFVLLGAINQNGGYALPYYNFEIDGNDHILQNAYVAFCLLQQYYAYDMPASQYEINGVQMVAQGIKKLKNQSIRFPVLTDPDLVELVKTNLGNGVIEKLSINLSSRNANATLKYDTE